ncbi:hypothetical protein GQ600_495 [Phytophthora cactorum]|nr:hypothetical protein GQ600_495 [Phytophthora cactorum]
MIYTTTILFVMASFVASLSQVGAHGYMYIRWRVHGLGHVGLDRADRAALQQQRRRLLDDVYASLKKSNGYSDIRTLLDSDTDLYGANCGFTDPDAAAKDPPTTGDAPSLIWLDDTMVLSNDDCQTAYGDGTQEKASVFTPVDYSSCSTSGCMLRFYWLAFQGVDSKTVWQVYKDCVPLTGPAEGLDIDSSGTSDTSLTAESPQITTATPTSNEASTETTTDAPASTPSPSEKCTARKRQ